ncbi:MAG: imidazolonepropionase [Planctomycetes bacterium]|nr:imidazolonepropionase [Planctomycetota bacterium]NOG53736.1 imidazolonepropionase [Planctomycetota bacterium]
MLTQIINARIVTPRSGTGPKHGREAMRDLAVIAHGYVVADDSTGLITAVGDMGSCPKRDVMTAQVLDAGGRLLLPGFVDCHTHACWAGERLDEFQQKLEGADYLSILKAGGGIMSTVRATRQASQDELAAGLVARVHRMAAFGSTTIEVKSGYGLNTEAELKMLRAIGQAAGQVAPVRLVPTALIAHAVDTEQGESFVTRTIEETLPAVASEFPGIAVDGYCEDGAWSLEQTRRLFDAAVELGCRLRVHTDQFHSLGATRMAIEMGAASVDHLEAVTDDDIELLGIGGAPTLAVALPVSGFQLDERYAPGRKLIDAGAAVAIATNYNPGSAPSPSMPFAMALACRKCGLTPSEAITAATWNAAHVLGMGGVVGAIGEGQRADLVLWDEVDERALAYEVAGVPAVLVMAGGQPVSPVDATQ